MKIIPENKFPKFFSNPVPFFLHKKANASPPNVQLDEFNIP
jgi:hypothetical protein